MVRQTPAEFPAGHGNTKCSLSMGAALLALAFYITGKHFFNYVCRRIKPCCLYVCHDRWQLQKSPFSRHFQDTQRTRYGNTSCQSSLVGITVIGDQEGSPLLAHQLDRLSLPITQSAQRGIWGCARRLDMHP